MRFVQSIAKHLYHWRRKLATGGVSLIAAYVFFHVVFGTNGWVTYRNKKVEYRKLQQEVEHIQSDNDRLQGQIKALKSDPKAIEKEAREQLKYAKPGEVVYVMPAPRPQPQTNTGLAQK